MCVDTNFTQMEKTDTPRGPLAFIGLAPEYCAAIENAAASGREEFTALMLRLLPRIYITASDLAAPLSLEEYEPLAPYLEAESYEMIRSQLAALMGEDDSFLDTPAEAMRLSEEPVVRTVSESLADIYQPLLDCAIAVRDSEGALMDQATGWARETFDEYWGQTIVDVLRPLHHLFYNRQ